MPLEVDPEHLVSLTLVPVGPGEHLDEAGEGGRILGQRGGEGDPTALTDITQRGQYLESILDLTGEGVAYLDLGRPVDGGQPGEKDEAEVVSRRGEGRNPSIRGHLDFHRVESDGGCPHYCLCHLIGVLLEWMHRRGFDGLVGRVGVRRARGHAGSTSL